MMDPLNTTVSLEGPDLLGTLKHNGYVRICVTIITILVATRMLSSHWYKQAKYSNAINQTPPTLPYWIPFFRHAFSMAWDTKRFAARCLAKYGDGTPFFIDAAGRKLLILLDSDQIKRVLTASKELDPNPFIHEMILGQMLGSPKETIDFYKNDNGKMDHVQMAHIRQHVTGSGLVSMTEKFYERLNSNIRKEISQSTESSWYHISDLFAFVQDHITVALTETVMGTEITKQYPDMTADQWTFMDRSIEIVMGIPRSVMSGAYDARDRLLANLKIWNARSEALRLSGKADPSWDANAGSGMLQERQERYAASPGFSEDARVSQILGLLFAGNGLTPPVSFWYLFETLKDPSIFRRITEELRSSFDAQKDTYDFMTLTQQPFLQSLHAETTRMYSSNVAQRVVTTPTFALSDKYTVTQGTTLFIYTKPTALFTPGWTEARAESTTKPLDTFWAERFLVGGDTKRERYSHAGLSGCWTSFGGGEHKCPGRHFARNVGIGALAVLLGHYECELVDNEGKINVRPNIRETAFGKMQPTKKVEARLRRRQ